jgi:hypothetical protein
LHFQPIVPPALPETTTKYVLIEVPRMTSLVGVKVKSESAHVPSEVLSARSVIFDEGMPPEADHRATEKVDGTEEPLASFALRSLIRTEERYVPTE